MNVLCKQGVSECGRLSQQEHRQEEPDTVPAIRQCRAYEAGRASSVPERGGNQQPLRDSHTTKKPALTSIAAVSRGARNDLLNRSRTR